MYKQAVNMVLLVGLMLSAAAIANGGSLKSMPYDLYASIDHGLEVLNAMP